MENRNTGENREDETIAKAGRKEEEGRTKGLGAIVRNRNKRGTGNNIEHRKEDEKVEERYNRGREQREDFWKTIGVVICKC